MGRRFAFGGSNKNTLIIAVVVVIAVYFLFFRNNEEASNFGAVSFDIPWFFPKSRFGATSPMPMSNWSIAQAGANAIAYLIVNSDPTTFNKFFSNASSIFSMPEANSTQIATSQSIIPLINKLAGFAGIPTNAAASSAAGKLISAMKVAAMDTTYLDKLKLDQTSIGRLELIYTGSSKMTGMDQMMIDQMKIIFSLLKTIVNPTYTNMGNMVQVMMTQMMANKPGQYSSPPPPSGPGSSSNPGYP
jgi:hypothetical protein